MIFFSYVWDQIFQAHLHQSQTPKISNQNASNNNSRFNAVADKHILNVQNYSHEKAPYKLFITTVYFVKDKRTNKRYAAKCSNIEITETEQLHILREINILMQVQNPTIVNFEGVLFKVFENNDRIAIFTEYAENRSLDHLIDLASKASLPYNFTLTDWQIILIGISYGMMLLHQNLKPGNALIDGKFKPHLTDFGVWLFKKV